MFRIFFCSLLCFFGLSQSVHKYLEANALSLQENSYALITPVEKGDFINGNIKLKYGEIKVNVPSKSGKIILGICLPCKTGCLGHKLEFSQTVFRVKIENVAEKPRK